MAGLAGLFCSSYRQPYNRLIYRLIWVGRGFSSSKATAPVSLMVNIALPLAVIALLRGKKMREGFAG